MTRSWQEELTERLSDSDDEQRACLLWFFRNQRGPTPAEQRPASIHV